MKTDVSTVLSRVPIRMFLPPDCQRVTPKIIKARAWEPESTEWLLSGIRRGDTFVDVGAHVGYFALIAAKTVGAEGHVYAFEPNPDNFALLEKNKAANVLPNLVAEEKAVTNKRGKVRLYLNPENSGDHRIAKPEQSRRFIWVETAILDNYFRELGQTRVDLAKIDTQGAEVGVLEGMSEILRENRRMRLIVEFWPYGLSLAGHEGDGLLGVLDDGGFALSRGERDRLLGTYTVENRKHTNLRLEKGGFTA